MNISPSFQPPVRLPHFSGVQDLKAPSQIVLDVNGLQIVEITDSPVSKAFREAVVAAVKQLPVSLQRLMAKNDTAIVLTKRLSNLGLEMQGISRQVACYISTIGNVVLPEIEVTDSVETPFELKHVDRILRHESGHSVDWGRHRLGEEEKILSASKGFQEAYEQDLKNLGKLSKKILMPSTLLGYYLPFYAGGEHLNPDAAREECFAEVHAALQGKGCSNPFLVKAIFSNTANWIRTSVLKSGDGVS